MPRDGYKGVCFVDDRCFVVCDDGDHVVYLGVLNSEGTGCSLAVIAGEKGVAETVDAEVGTQAKCNKPDGPCVDRENWMLYFCDRGSKTVRRMSLRPPYAVHTVVSVADVPTHSGEVPPGKIDPLRIILSPTEDAAFVAERKQGYIYKIVGLRSETPEVYMYHDNADRDMQLLHGMSWPIAPVHGCSVWDTEHHQWAGDPAFTCEHNFTANDMHTCANFFLVVGGNKAWFVDATHTDRTTNPRYTLACDFALALERYQADEGIFLTSNTVLALNRNSRRPGMWQVTTHNNWALEGPHTCRWIADRGMIAPHGMDLSPSRRLVLMADTGCENKGALLLARISLSPEQAEVRVHTVEVLEENEQPLEQLEPVYLNLIDEALVVETAKLVEMETEHPHRHLAAAAPLAATVPDAEKRTAAAPNAHGYAHLKCKPNKGKTRFEKEFRRKTAYGLSTNTRDSNCQQS